MSKPIIEQIAEKIKTAVDSITVANGYNQDLRALRPSKLSLDPADAADLTCFIGQGDPTEWEGGDRMVTRAWMVPFVLQVVVRESDSSALPIDSRMNQIYADIYKRMMDEENTLFDSLASEVEVGPPTREISIDFPVIGTEVRIYYRHKYDDPYTQN